jgi:transcriptional regulator with XRE-family HTH domain
MAAGFGAYLKMLRARAGWSVREVHRRTGLAEGRLYDLERGVERSTGKETHPSRKACKAIADAFNVPLGEVLAQAGYRLEGATSPEDHEMELLTMYRSLSPEWQRKVLQAMRVFTQQSGGQET